MSHSLQKNGPFNSSQWLPVAMLVLLIVFAFIEMSILSNARYEGFNTKYYDLGAMSQSVWTATEGKPLVFTGQGIKLSRLSRSVELIYFALAPLYALFPSPATLLIIQAALYAIGAVPVFWLARRKLAHQWLAVAVAAIYLLYPVAQTAVLAEFHSDPLALPFLMFAIEAADRRAWRSYTAWLLLALLCKFYVAAPVMVMGVVLWLKGERRAGLVTAVAAGTWGLFAFFVIRALFAPPAAEAALAVNVQASAAGYFFNRFQLAYVWDTAIIRLVHGVIVLMPALLLLGWRAPLWLLPAAVIIIPALVSNGFGPSFSYRTHHYVLAVPFLVTAVLMGAAKQRQQGQPQVSAGQRPAWQGRILLTLLVVIIFNLAFIDTPLSPTFYLDRPELGQGLSTTRFGVTSRDRMKKDWLAAQVPASVAVASDQLSATRLVNRETIYLTNYVFGRPLQELLPQVDVVITDALYDWYLADPGNPEQMLEAGVAHEHGVIRQILENPEFHLTAMRDGLLLFTRSGIPLTQNVTFTPDTGKEITAQFGDHIGLVTAVVTQTGDRRLHFLVEWRLLAPWPKGESWMAVSQLETAENSRIVHLPVTTLAPPSAWPTGQIVREEFEVLLPENLSAGQYAIRVGWYDTNHTFAAYTDERSRVGDEVVLGNVELR